MHKFSRRLLNSWTYWALFPTYSLDPTYGLIGTIVSVVLAAIVLSLFEVK